MVSDVIPSLLLSILVCTEVFIENYVNQIGQSYPARYRENVASARSVGNSTEMYDLPNLKEFGNLFC